MVRVPVVAGIRVDAGIDDGVPVGVHYDPMLAKVIAYGPSREEALRRMRFALDNLIVLGVRTNRAWLRRILDHAEVEAGGADTGFCERHADALAEPTAARDGREAEAALVAAIAESLQRGDARAVLPAIPTGWRNNRALDQWVEFEPHAGRTLRVTYRALGGMRFLAHTDERDGGLVTEGEAHAVEVLGREPAEHQLRVEVDGVQRLWHVAFDSERVWVHGAGAETELKRLPRLKRGGGAAADTGGLTAPMPGKVLRVLVEPGQEVPAGATLVILESMKMETSVTAPADGLVKAVHVDAGDQVDAGAALVDLETATEPAQ
jgi:propionyl-CoA carboxylase alpha chain